MFLELFDEPDLLDELPDVEPLVLEGMVHEP
jgi:hypothetical protein